MALCSRPGGSVPQAREGEQQCQFIERNTGKAHAARRQPAWRPDAGRFLAGGSARPRIRPLGR
jgi:hypothetical protein